MSIHINQVWQRNSNLRYPAFLQVFFDIGSRVREQYINDNKVNVQYFILDTKNTQKWYFSCPPLDKHKHLDF